MLTPIDGRVDANKSRLQSPVGVTYMTNHPPVAPCLAKHHHYRHPASSDAVHVPAWIAGQLARATAVRDDDSSSVFSHQFHSRLPEWEFA